MTDTTHIWLSDVKLDPDTLQRSIDLTHALTQQIRPRTPHRPLSLVTDDWATFASYTGRTSATPPPNITGLWHPGRPAAIFLAPRVIRLGTPIRTPRPVLIDTVTQQLAHHLTTDRHHGPQWRRSYAILLPLIAHLFNIELSTKSHLLTVMRRYNTGVSDLNTELEALRQEARQAKRVYSHLIPAV